MAFMILWVAFTWFIFSDYSIEVLCEGKCVTGYEYYECGNWMIPRLVEIECPEKSNENNRCGILSENVQLIKKGSE